MHSPLKLVELLLPPVLQWVLDQAIKDIFFYYFKIVST